MYYLLILAIGVERLVELIVSKRNARWAFAHGGREFGHNHYPVMVAIHTALLLGCVIEVWALHRPFIPWLCWPMLVLVALSQALRWWCVTTLGPRWNTLVIVSPRRRWSDEVHIGGCTTRTTWPSSPKVSRCHSCTRRGSPPSASRWPMRCC